MRGRLAERARETAALRFGFCFPRYHRHSGHQRGGSHRLRVPRYATSVRATFYRLRWRRFARKWASKLRLGKDHEPQPRDAVSAETPQRRSSADKQAPRSSAEAATSRHVRTASHPRSAPSPPRRYTTAQRSASACQDRRRQCSRCPFSYRNKSRRLRNLDSPPRQPRASPRRRHPTRSTETEMVCVAADDDE